MAKRLYEENNIQDLANAIREKNGSTDKYKASQMASKVREFEARKPEQEKTLDIVENGTLEVVPDEGKVMTKVTVNSNVIHDPYILMNSIMNRTITEFYTEESFGSSNQNFGCLFNNCSNLVKWATPNNIYPPGTYVFRSCNNLKYIDIGKPSTVAPALFYGRQLKGLSIVIRSETPPTLSGAFSGTGFDSTTSFYVPKASISQYETATNWATYAGCYKAIEDYPEITGGII